MFNIFKSKLGWSLAVVYLVFAFYINWYSLSIDSDGFGLHRLVALFWGILPWSLFGFVQYMLAHWYRLTLIIYYFFVALNSATLYFIGWKLSQKFIKH